MERLRSGSDRLDRILGGGLPADSIALIGGLPGTGKTILAQQFAMTNASESRPALYLSTIAEPMDKMVRFAQGLEYFDPAAVGRTVFFEDLGGELVDGGLESLRHRLSDLLRRRRHSTVTIDSFKAIGHHADRTEFANFIHDLAGELSVVPGTVLWLGEYGREELHTAPEFAVADAAVYLEAVEAAERDTRLLRVLKLRGSSYAGGAHTYRISSAGFDAFPRLADAMDPTSYGLDPGRVTSGVPALDDMLSDGFWPGSATLVAGPSGAGKTILGLQFIRGGAGQGEHGLYATMQENRTQLERVVNGMGWSWDEGSVSIHSTSPNDIYIDEWFWRLLERIEEVGARRLVIDSLTDLQAAAPDRNRFREFVRSLTTRCSRAGISLLMTYEVPDLFRSTRLSEGDISHLADNVILLHFVPDGPRLMRAVTVLKSRASDHFPESREFVIEQGGIKVGDPVSAL